MTSPNDPKGIEGEKPLKVRRGRVDSVDLYEVKDSELEILERGSPADIQLNFAIFALSLAFSAIGTLATATFTNITAKVTFIVVAVAGIMLGAFLLISWFRSRSSMKAICERIRNRIPREAVTPSEPPSRSLPPASDTLPQG